MLLFLPSLLAWMAAPAAQAYQGGDIEIFKRICLSGEGRFGAGKIAETDFASLPSAMRVELEFPRLPDQPPSPASMAKRNRKPSVRASGQYFKILGGDRVAFLAIEERGLVGQPTHGRYCSLATKATDLRSAVLSLEKNARVDSRSLGWMSLSSGYRLRADKLNNGYLLLQSVITGKDEARGALERLRPTADEASKAKIDEMLKTKDPQ